MRRSVTSCLLFFLLLFLSRVIVQAQDTTTWTKKWYVPSHVKVQYAGSMGMFAVGAGYNTLRKKTDLDIYAGLLPQKYSTDKLYVFTFKVTQSFFSQKRINSQWSIMPLTAGIYLTYTVGERFSTKLPNQYPSGYYWWTESIRPNIFIGGNIRYSRPNRSPVSFYYELGTNELKAVSYAESSGYLSIWDILHLGLGLKFNLHRIN